MIDSLEEKVKKYILEHQLISQGEGVVVGVSGGPDSLCLAHILLGLRKSLGFEICLAHLNHSLRGEESEDEMDFVSRLSREWDVTAIFETVDVYNYIFKKHLSLEEAARNLRYGFFARAAFQFQGSKAAVGHTADDQVETVLMHMLRGSGIRGIRGMSPLFKWTGAGTVTVIRPLLSVWRHETEEYCRLHSLEPRLDSSNIDRAFLRNRLRLDLVPYLQNINPGAKEAILRLAKITAQEGAYLEGEVEKLYKEAIVEVKSGKSPHEVNSSMETAVKEPALSPAKGLVLFLKTDKILSHHLALQRLLLLKALEKMLGRARDLESHHIERLRSALSSRAGSKVSLPDGLFFLRDYEGGWLCHHEEEICPFPPMSGEQELPADGQIISGGWKIKIRRLKDFEIKHLWGEKSEARIQEPESPLYTLHSQHLTPVSPNTISESIERTKLSTLDPQLQSPDSRLWTLDSKQPLLFRAFLSLDRVKGKLVVRSRKPGDRFQPLGMDVPKKLQDFMTDEKIPRWWREHIPLICAGDDILWVVGWRLSELAKVQEGEKNIIEMELKSGNPV